MLWKSLRDALRPETVYAHCDIPCGIYDPHTAQMAAHTVVRMVDLIHELPDKKDVDDTTRRTLLVRYTKTKEDHAELAKHEVRVLWGDYFRKDHLKEVPGLNDLVWDTLKKASEARQTVDRKAAQDLLDAVNRIAQAFWKTKGLATETVKAPYPTAKPFVVPKFREEMVLEAARSGGGDARGGSASATSGGAGGHHGDGTKR